MKKILISILLIISALSAISQQSTIIDSKSMTVPRYINLAAIQSAITSPQTGMMVYNNDTQSYWFYSSGGWANLAASVSGAWAATGTDISNTNTGNVGIGVANPDYPLVTKGRIRIRDSGSGESAGVWFNTNGNASLRTFIGMDPSSNFGIFSAPLGRNIFTANVSNSNIGIDITNPGHKLHINSNPATGGTAGLRVEGPATTGGVAASFGGFGDISVDKPGIIGGRFVIKNDGNIGVGTNSPNTLLDVNGTIGIRNNALSFKNADGTYTSNNIYSSNGYLVLNGGSADGGNGVAINNTGSVINAIQFNADGTLEIGGEKGNVGDVLTSGGTGGSRKWAKPYATYKGISLSSGNAPAGFGAYLTGAFISMSASALSVSVPNTSTQFMLYLTVQFKVKGYGSVIVEPKCELEITKTISSGGGSSSLIIPFYSTVGDHVIGVSNYPFLVNGGTIHNFSFLFYKLQNGTINIDAADLCVSAVLVPLN